MSAETHLARLCDLAGVVRHYHGISGDQQAPPPETLRAILGAMELDAANEGEAEETAARLEAERRARALPLWRVIAAEAPSRIEMNRAGEWRLEIEDGDAIEGRADGAIDLPPLASGIHLLHLGDDVCTILSAPPRLPPPPRTWGLTLPLYGLRTPQAGGIGDYADLARAMVGADRQGAGFVGVNPIHAGFFGDDQAISPYSPSHRRRFDVMHVATPAPGPEPDGPLIDPAHVRGHKRAALAAFFERTGGMEHEAAFTTFRATGGVALTRFVIHQALSEVHGPYWSSWPEPYKDPQSSEVKDFVAANAHALRYHAWLQFEAERQLAEVAAAGAEMAVGLYLDLAVGTHPHGAETWSDPRAFARGVSLGAPPDAFTPSGQKWGLAPLQPRQLERNAFRAIAETLRQQLRFAGMLRIDHILGFERAFWVPDEDIPGTYVRMPKAAMLAVARIEAARTGSIIVGEDLGNVPEGLREDMEGCGILGCRVAQFERAWDEQDQRFLAPDEYDELVLTSFSTHDLPTWRGWRAARDIDWFARVGAMPEDALPEQKEKRQADVAALAEGQDVDSLDAMHRHLGETRSKLVALQLEDILEQDEQANLPGTVDAHPNWRRRMPVGPEALEDDQRLARAAEIMAECNR